MEKYRNFFALCKLSLNLNLGCWYDRWLINKTEFRNFMNNRRNHLTIEQLESAKRDLLNNLEGTIKMLKKFE